MKRSLQDQQLKTSFESLRSEDAANLPSFDEVIERASSKAPNGIIEDPLPTAQPGKLAWGLLGAVASLVLFFGILPRLDSSPSTTTVDFEELHLLVDDAVAVSPAPDPLSIWESPTDFLLAPISINSISQPDTIQ